MTTAANTSVTVEAGQTAGVQFGSRLRLQTDADPVDEPDSVADVATVVPTPAVDEGEETAAANPQSNGLASWSGLILLVVAVILLGAILFMVLRRTA